MTYATAAPATAGGNPGAPVCFTFNLAESVCSRRGVEVSDFCSYLIDSIIIIKPEEHMADLLAARMSELRDEHYTALETR
jgi:hypothetical protein